MVYATAMGAIAISSIKRRVMYKPIKVLVDDISYHHFFCMRIFTAFIVWKYMFETRGTITIVSG